MHSLRASETREAVSAYTLSPRAQHDVQAIWDYTVQHWGTKQAAFYLHQINRAIESAADDPKQAIACDHIRKGYYKYRVNSHVIFYRLTAQGINVVRILHQRMDFSSHL